MMGDEKIAIQILCLLGQQHLLPLLTPELNRQIASLDLPLIARLQESIEAAHSFSARPLARIAHQRSSQFGQNVLSDAEENPEGRVNSTLPRDALKADDEIDGQNARMISEESGLETSGNEENRRWGEALLSQGKVACVVLAGGMGSRLGLQGPKGCVPVSVIKKKSLYQLIAEKTRAASLLYKRHLPIAWMISPLNHEQTSDFFTRHRHFGLHEESIFFFVQSQWPCFNCEKKLFLGSRESLAWGPNGNGGVFRHLVSSGILTEWERKGVEYVRVMPIDNPLADPFDAELVGFLDSQSADIAVQAVTKMDPNEPAGSLVMIDGKISVQEYTAGSCLSQLINIGLYCFSVPFIKRIHDILLPIHCVKKRMPIFDKGRPIFPQTPNVWKCEEYIFDTFPYSNKTSVLLTPRERCFAPLKNYSGEGSMEPVQTALLQADRNAFEALTGTKLSNSAVFELAQEFHYPTIEIKQKWKGKQLPKNKYIIAL